MTLAPFPQSKTFTSSSLLPLFLGHSLSHLISCAHQSSQTERAQWKQFIYTCYSLSDSLRRSRSRWRLWPPNQLSIFYFVSSSCLFHSRASLLHPRLRSIALHCTGRLYVCFISLPLSCTSGSLCGVQLSIIIHHHVTCHWLRRRSNLLSNCISLYSTSLCPSFPFPHNFSFVTAIQFATIVYSIDFLSLSPLTSWTLLCSGRFAIHSAASSIELHVMLNRLTFTGFLSSHMWTHFIRLYVASLIADSISRQLEAITLINWRNAPSLVPSFVSVTHSHSLFLFLFLNRVFPFSTGESTDHITSSGLLVQGQIFSPPLPLKVRFTAIK